MEIKKYLGEIWKKFAKSKEKGRHGFEESKLEFLKKEMKKQYEKKAVLQQRKKRLREYLDKAGIEVKSERISKIFFNLAIAVNLIISAYIIYFYSTSLGITWEKVFTSMVLLWVVVFVFILFILWIVFYVIIDLKIFKRKVEIEDVLPDFLQLAASNIKAGMTVDKALWYAVRPRFGVLAKEIESVAKETMSGNDLKESLIKFSSKYDSVVLKRAVNMLIEGIDAGGKIGDLLDKIADNIKEQKIMVKEIGASVTTYTIFISFASIGAAPILYALSKALIVVIESLGSSLGSMSSTASSVGIPLSFSGTGITNFDFTVFSIVSIIISSAFSAMMISTIKKGNVKSGAKYIPIFIAVALAVYFVSSKVISSLMGTVF